MIASAPRALVLDFDQTLVALSGFVRWADAAASMRERYRLGGIGDEVIANAPRGCLSLYAHMAGRAEPTQDLQHEVSKVLASFEGEAVGKAPLLPGARELLETLPELQLRAAIVSSNDSSVIRAILATHGVEDLVAAIVGRDHVRHIKPSPEGMLRCCALLGVPTPDCLAVGDNAGDVEASSAAGVPAAGITNGVSSRAELLRAGALRVFDHLGELTTELRRWREAERGRG